MARGWLPVEALQVISIKFNGFLSARWVIELNNSLKSGNPNERAEISTANEKLESLQESLSFVPYLIKENWTSQGSACFRFAGSRGIKLFVREPTRFI
jgi:hypothetical protein